MKFYRIALYLIVGSHAALVMSMAGAIPYLLIFEPWYVSAPLVVWIVNLAILPVRCPLTYLENVVRDKLGMKRISGFLFHYLWRFI